MSSAVALLSLSESSSVSSVPSLLLSHYFTVSKKKITRGHLKKKKLQILLLRIISIQPTLLLKIITKLLVTITVINVAAELINVSFDNENNKPCSGI
jgi:hypothetical protein